ncbi:adenylate/guanylate cyclase domain-containing protein [Heliophilum fasciatum]|uniref:Class 3 adenylate cyclase n=1 Tax=Heliophilum fasciatum TaxID=35700 RepID=A0A4R2RGA6_9FIRM|nr:adenylate/guanylate cyclase domain-containing protein [Heliophilum fasciatum]MCW2279010.1 class 3 adenylate cyclase [Heliophilum fasciatum]TCP61754.1 class 3 adenylate cyclase [Heliophilum fasciatum]
MIPIKEQLIFGYIAFSDLKGFSSLNPEELKKYHEILLPKLGEVLGGLIKKAIVYNTWGDALFTVFESAKEATEFTLQYRDFFEKEDITIRPRISLHYGEVSVFNDPILGRTNAVGENINLTARIEPVTLPGEIFISKDAYDQLIIMCPHLRYDRLESIKLPKDAGTIDLYWMRRHEEVAMGKESPKERLYRLRDDIRYFEKELKQTLIPRFFAEDVPSIVEIDTAQIGKFIENKSAFELVCYANKLMNSGDYLNALACADAVESSVEKVFDCTVRPYEGKMAEVRITCLSHLGRYDEAAQLALRLMDRDTANFEPICLLADQIKKKALAPLEDGVSSWYDIEDDIEKYKALKHARYLYQFASRRAGEHAYYPLINFAYLSAMLDPLEPSDVAAYILHEYNHLRGRHWWVDITLAEAAMLMEDYTDALERVANAIKIHQPDPKKLDIVSRDIRLYIKALQERDLNLERNVRPILAAINEGLNCIK